MKKSYCIGGSGGGLPAHAPLYRTQFFCFHIHFHRKVPTLEAKTPPKWVHAPPPLRKILDPALYWIRANKQSTRRLVQTFSQMFDYNFYLSKWLSLPNLHSQIDGYVEKSSILSYLEPFGHQFMVLPNFITIEITNLREQLYSIAVYTYVNCCTSFYHSNVTQATLHLKN